MIETAKTKTIPTTSSPRAGRFSEFISDLRYDIPASLVVFLVAVPLSLGIAIASGAPILAGLISAVLGGIVGSLLGGSAMQVSGPSAALTMIMAETISTFGWATTCAITMAAGALQILFGLSRIARAALALSPAIVHGMLAGIGVTIVLGQLHVVLGGTAQTSAIANVLALPGQLIARHDGAVMIGLLTIGILLIWPRLPQLVRRIPAPLAAIAISTGVAVVSGMSVPKIALPGDLFSIHFTPILPTQGWGGALVAALSIALIAGVESLLSAVTIDKLRNAPRTNLNRELIGQGVTNMIVGAVGGFPVTGVIVRSLTNFTAGARSKASAVLHGVWILLFTLVLAGALQNIPLAALAGLLVYVGAKLVDIGQIKEVLRHGDLPVYLVTLAGSVAVNLLTGIAVGIVLSLIMMLRRSMWSGVHIEREEDRSRVVVEGTLTFLSVPRLSKMLTTIEAKGTVVLELVVDYMDHAAFESLLSWQQSYERGGGTVIVDEIGHPWFGRGKTKSPIVRRSAVGKVIPRWLAPWGEWQTVHGEHEVPTPRSSSALAGTGPTHRGTYEFQRRIAPLLEQTLSSLAHGQQPHTLFVTCGDARVVPNVLTSSGPGDLFTVRNIGNVIPLSTPETGDTSVGAAIEYAVGVLRVREIVICGHSSCGAMKALSGEAPGGMPNLEKWLRHAESSLFRRATESALLLDGKLPPTEADELALHNVLQQLDNLRRYPIVADAEARGELHLTGMYFHVGAAQVHLFDPEVGSFVRAGAIRSAVRSAFRGRG
jgi:carbonic anhydrase